MRRIIRDKGTTQRTVSAKFVAKAIGAEDTGIKIDTKRGPISLFTLRQVISEKLHSTGGRPKLRGARKVRSKISFIDEDWEKLEEFSKYYKEEEGIKVTSSQIASALIHAEISKININDIKHSGKSGVR